MQFTSPEPFNEAVDKLGEKSIIGSKLNSAEWADVPVGLRERAFFSSTVENARFLQRSKDFIGNFLTGVREDGGALAAGSRSQFVKELNTFAVGEGMGPLTPEDTGTLKDITSQKRLNLIFDTQVQQAQDFGYWKQGQDPDVLDEFPAQRFIRVQEVKVPRPYHQLNEGRVELKSDLDFWLSMNPDFGVPWGPWGFNSGMGVEDVDRAEAESLGLIQPGETPTPIDLSFNDRLEASTRGLDSDILGSLESAFGKQVTIDGDSARWNDGFQPEESVVPDIGNTSEDAPIRTLPVSDAIDLTNTRLPGIMQQEVVEALKSIDMVHDDGALPRLPIKRAPVAADYEAAYFHRSTQALRLEINGRTQFGRHAAVHEIGHFIDQQGLGDGVFASAESPDLAAWRDAVDQSQAVRALRLTFAATSGRNANLEYLLRYNEIFARAYSQWITMESGDRVLAEQLTQIRSVMRNNAFWTDEDFKPIAKAFEDAFKAKGWL